MPAKKEYAIGTGIFLLVLVLAHFIHPEVLKASWLSIAPPMLAIVLAFTTHRVIFSLFLAIVGGSFLGSGFIADGGLDGFAGGLLQTYKHTSTSLIDGINMQILGFVIFIFAALKVVMRTGGLIAFVNRLSDRVKGKRSAELVTGLLGLLMFIDDYANTLIVGTTMQKVCDRFGVSREKLAFIVDATSAPVAGIAIVSTWIGYEIGLFQDLTKKFNIDTDGYGIFFDIFAMRFYCFFMLVFVFWNILTRIDFGPMAKTSPVPMMNESEGDQKEGSIVAGVVPILFIVFSVFIGLWADGGGFESGTIYSLDSWREILSASSNGTRVLLLSAVGGFLMAVILAFFLAKISLQDIVYSVGEGLKGSLLPICILVLAWSLKSVCDQLGTGPFLVSLIKDSMSAELLPAVVFIVAGVTAFSTGTSWGTMAILIPTVAPVAIHFDGGYGLITMISLAAILDGAIFGDHCSPISDTTIMSSIATNCSLISHVKTQLPYAVMVGLCALVFGYLPMGYGVSLGVSWGLFLVFLCGLYFVLKMRRSLTPS